jgi:hypothetical protein
VPRELKGHIAYINRTTLNSDYLAALYIVDEPFWNSLPYNDLAKVTRYLKLKIPGVPLFFVEAYPAIPNLKIPPELDWIGFDHYGVYSPQTDIVYTQELKTLKQKMSSHQKIVLIMESQWLDEYDRLDVKPFIMAAIAKNYYQLAKTETKVIGIMGYPWAGGLDGPTQKGARELPLIVRQTYQQIGLEILSRY